MIKKLRHRIFFIIMISLSIVIIGVIILFTFFNYTNTINTSTSMLDKFINFEPRKVIAEREDADNKMNFDINLEGIYTFKIENSKIIEASDKTNNETIAQYAIKISNGKTENGVIGDYIYKVRRTKTNNTVILMENKTVVTQIKIIIIFSVIGSAISLIIIYSIAKKLSEVIVELKKDKNNIILQVKNMGEQIPENEREKIFERFYRIDKSRNRNEKRYGLGLAIAKSTTQKYNGSIEVFYKNGFTIFKVTIPI